MLVVYDEKSLPKANSRVAKSLAICRQELNSVLLTPAPIVCFSWAQRRRADRSWIEDFKTDFSILKIS